MTVQLNTDYGLLEAGGGAASVPTTRLVTAGAGLTGGGDLSADRTLDVAATDATIIVAANGIKADLAHLISTDVVTVTASPHTIASTTRFVNVDTVTVAATLNLPDPALRQLVYVKDSTGNANANNITVARFGSEKIEGITASKVLSAAWGSWLFYTDGTDWFVVS